MSNKLKIQQSPALHQDPDAGKLRHEDDDYWNFHWRGLITYDESTSVHEVHEPDASRSS
jgi:hypothetical protein